MYSKHHILYCILYYIYIYIHTYTLLRCVPGRGLPGGALPAGEHRELPAGDEAVLGGSIFIVLYINIYIYICIYIYI